MHHAAAQPYVAHHGAHFWEQELAERTRTLAAKLGLGEAELAEAESIEYAGAALCEDSLLQVPTT